MKRIVYLTFYFQPDLSAGSFRNSSLAIELSLQAKLENVVIDVYTSMPNRYNSFEVNALKFEELDNMKIHRIKLPTHKSGMFDQVFAYLIFYINVLKLNRNKKVDLVFASSSRLFTAYLGYRLARKYNALLYLDIRDIFVDTMNDVFKLTFLKNLVLPILKNFEKRAFNFATHINLISGGFKEYFKNYNENHISFFSNGIDDEFLLNKMKNFQTRSIRSQKLIVYAGNIGEGQGLHRIIPEAALLLGDKFQFLVIGDGGARDMLINELARLRVTNVILEKPIDRKELHVVYNNADYLFIHLNDYPAFRKVLPSKIFELATFNKPILAGVSGFSAQFIEAEISHSFIFEPCNVKALVNFLLSSNYDYHINRDRFTKLFKRERINKDMAKSILSYL
jgi:hypothetical protein